MLRVLKFLMCSVPILMFVALCLAESREYHLTADNDSLADYLQHSGLKIPSFTTLVFSSGVHSMCEDGVVVSRDATDIALIGDDVTYTKSVQIGGGKTVDVIEPSTVIDCYGCSTGFAFQNVSRLTLRRISIRNCGAYFNTLLNHTQFVSSLTLASVYTLTLDTLSFHGKGKNFSLVAINVLGLSTITNVSVLHEVNGEGNWPWALPLSYIEGGILISYTDDLLVQYNINSSTPDLSIDTLSMFYTVHFHLGYGPPLVINILSCTLDSVSILLQNVRVHIWLNDTNILLHREDVVRLEVAECVQNYRVCVKNVNLNASVSDLVYKLIYLMYKFVVHFSSSSHRQSFPSFMKKMEFSQLQLSDGYKLRIISSIAHSGFTNKCHQILIDDCKLFHFLVDINVNPNFQENMLNITVSNTLFKYRFTMVLLDYNEALFEARGARKISVNNCIFENNFGPGIHLIQSHITFSGNCVIYNNTADYGGGILLESRSLLYLAPHTTLNFTGNTAKVTGGAMHIGWSENGDNLCLFQINMTGFSSTKDIKSIADELDIKIVFESNTATIAGTTIWGGSFDRDGICFMIPMSYTNIFPLLGLDNNASNPSVIASAPLHMCYCYNNQTMTCTHSGFGQVQDVLSFSIYPGQSLELDIGMTDQMNGLVPGLVEATIDLLGNDIDVRIDDVQKTQRINRAECTMFVYTFYTTTVTARIQLILQIAEGVRVNLDYVDVADAYVNDALSFRNRLYIDVKLKGCPLGFHHDPVISSCVCQKAILKYVSSPCDINTQTVERKATLWMNASYTGNNTQLLAVHEHCPFDYCGHNKLRVDLSDPDQQCANNRAGILCGGCKAGLSLTLGSPKCKHCSNSYISLLAAFITAGLALVVILTFLNLTVSTGTINALILYANIIRALNSIFFPTTTFLSVFVAWLNLDIGIDTCFYDGLDFYSLTWLQFIFPVYIWLLVSVMIITSHYSTRVSKLVSRDAVKVLATLFLLSYAKLLRTILTVLSFTYISYEDTIGATHQTAVWLYDGNVEFARGKHIPLLLTALGFGVVYIIPFTALLLFAPFLQMRSHRYKVLKWVNKVMPFLDAYQGPYNDKFRFWPGLILLFRVVLFISFALNSLGDPDINLMLITTLVLVLLSFQLLLGMALKSDIPYKNTYLNYLEIFYLLDLGVLCTWSVLQPDRITSSHTRRPSVTSSVLVGMAFIVFIGILSYHVYLRIKTYSVLMRLYQRLRRQRGNDQEVPTVTSQQGNNEQTRYSGNVTYITFRETLLASNDML